MPKKHHLEQAAKRLIDITAATAGLVATAPLLVASATAIRLVMGKPVLFRQPRPGKDGAIFEMVKFRTMRPLREGENLVASDAARLGRLGSFLRKSSIDELPTLWNVLKGDMSLVGPRPLLVRYLERYTPEQARRHEVKPGLTGWAQIHGRNALSWEQKFALDVWYVDHWSLKLDLEILARTAWLVVRGSGVSSPEHATMPEFLGTRGAA